jgi:predicted nucleic acid-binding protein
MAMVLDASMALTWCFPDELTAHSQSVFSMLRDQEAVVPGVWPLEVADALLVGERRQRLGPALISRSVELLLNLSIRIESNDLSQSLGIIRMLAREHALSTYDASYLDLAIASGLPLATADRRLSEAATALGVPLVQ